MVLQENHTNYESSSDLLDIYPMPGAVWPVVIYSLTLILTTPCKEDTILPTPQM